MSRGRKGKGDPKVAYQFAGKIAGKIAGQVEGQVNSLFVYGSF